ncbi:ABC transporter periplasmic histidine-binding protein precursor [Neisseria gonorrhoeae]|uniref:ABC transporter periplasmic histidine-binding protein n=1 Tax=Neisseria gonorrhoeae TaxID=485 RepID=A0A378VWI7_NEIGO|nr:ABC transporter periplasmic histidine-binding protein precursor [Neisseria gonorrhoeae]
MNKVGVVTGHTGDFSVSKLLGNDNPKIARFENVPLIIKELENGGLDSVVSDSAVIANYVKTTRPKEWTSLPCPTSPPNTTASRYAKATKQPSKC